jgi:hypothetical protein
MTHPMSLLSFSSSTIQRSPKSITAAAVVNRPVSRAAFVAGLVASSAAFLLTPSTAHAAKYGAFGADAATGGLDRSTAEIDAAILSSAAVQDALRTIRAARQQVTQLQQQLTAHPQAVVKSTAVGDPYQLREAFNRINAAFDEETQRNTDRLIRTVVQDLLEIDTAAAQKEGIARSPRRLEAVQQKLAKLARTLDDFLAFTV